MRVPLTRYSSFGPSGLGLGNTFSNISNAWEVLYPENPRLITSKRREQSFDPVSEKCCYLEPRGTPK